MVGRNTNVLCEICSPIIREAFCGICVLENTLFIVYIGEDVIAKRPNYYDTSEATFKCMSKVKLKCDNEEIVVAKRLWYEGD